MTIIPVPTGKSIEQAIEAAREFAGRLVLPPIEELGLVLGDQVRSFRLKRQIQLLLTAQKRLEEAGIDPRTVPLKTFVPLLEGASLEEDPGLREKWVGLLASAAAGEVGPHVLPTFPFILRQLSPLDAAILERLAGLNDLAMGVYVERPAICSQVEAEANDVDIAVDTLLGQGLVERQPEVVIKDQSVTGFTDRQALRISQLGQRFVLACRGPEREGGR